MKRPLDIFIPFTLFLLSFALRLSLISKGPYHLDCLILATKSEELLRTFQLPYFWGTGYPLSIILGAGFVLLGELFGCHDPVMMVNVMAVITSSLSITMLYLITSRLLDETTAVLSSALFCFTPIFLGISVIGLSQAPSMLFLLTGIYFLICFQKNPRKQNLIGAGIFIGLMAASRLQDTAMMAVPLSLLILFPVAQPSNEAGILQRLRIATHFWMVAGLTALIFYLPYLLTNSREIYIKQFMDYVSTSEGFNTGWILGRTSSIIIKNIIISLAWPGLAAALMGWLVLAKKENLSKTVFLLSWLLVPLLFLAYSFYLSPRYLVIALPPLFIAEGYLLSTLLNKNKWVKVLSLVFCLVNIFYMLIAIYPQLLFRHERARLPDYARWIRSQTEDNAVIVTHDDCLFLAYYGERRCVMKPIDHIKSPLTKDRLMEFKLQLDGFLKKGTPVYFTAQGLYVNDARKKIIDMVFDNYELSRVGDHFYEDWHRGPIQFQLYYFPLVRISLPATKNDSKE